MTTSSDPTDINRLRALAESTVSNLQSHGVGSTPDNTNVPVKCATILALLDRLEAAEHARDDAQSELAFIDRTYAKESDDKLTADAREVADRSRLVADLRARLAAAEKERDEQTRVAWDEYAKAVRERTAAVNERDAAITRAEKAERELLSERIQAQAFRDDIVADRDRLRAALTEIANGKDLRAYQMSNIAGRALSAAEGDQRGQGEGRA
jgi:hypothetical protein